MFKLVFKLASLVEDATTSLACLIKVARLVSYLAK